MALNQFINKIIRITAFDFNFYFTFKSFRILTQILLCVEEKLTYPSDGCSEDSGSIKKSTLGILQLKIES